MKFSMVLQSISLTVPREVMSYWRDRAGVTEADVRSTVLDSDRLVFRTWKDPST